VRSIRYSRTRKPRMRQRDRMNAHEQYEEYKRLEAEYKTLRREDSCDCGFSERLMPYDRIFLLALKIKT
jgi:hypothetical protein